MIINVGSYIKTSSFARKTLDFLKYGDTRPATYISVISAIVWTACLLFPGDTLARPTYRIMAMVAPEPVWIVIFSSMASLQMWRLYARSRCSIIPLEHVIKFMVVIVWTFVSFACMLAQYPPAAAVSDTIAVALATWWDFVRYEPCKLCKTNDCNTGCPYDRV